MSCHFTWISVVDLLAASEKISPVEVTAQDEPACPNCNGAMIKRVSKKSDNAGREFWGCQIFPKCRGVVSIEISN